MKYKREKGTPEKLFLGLVIGLAGSLCMLEYGKPLAAVYIPNGDIGEIIDFADEPVRITLPEPELPEYVEPEKVNDHSTELNIVPDEVATPENNNTDPFEEFQVNDSGLYIPDFVSEQEIILDMPFVLVEQKPIFEGLERFLGENVKYPPRRRDVGDQGYVAVQFTVTHTGAIDKESIKILRSPHQDFTKEVMRVMKKMPDWEPGKQRGKPVNVTHTLPIRFKLKS